MKPYLYPASIEFSIICATIFVIIWIRIGSSEHHHRSLLASDDTRPYDRNAGKKILLDLIKTKGIFFGLIVFVGTLVSVIMSTMYIEKEDWTAVILSKATETFLLLIALVLTIIAYFKVTKYYTKVIPYVNVFDVVLIVVSMFGIYVYSINSLIAVTYYQAETANMIQIDGESANLLNVLWLMINISSEILSIIQGTIQTFFILECLRRYNINYSTRKPCRELITALLLVNVSLWCNDTFASKRFDTNITTVEHFGILKWTIIHVFSSPLVTFYRLHSTVCLSSNFSKFFNIITIFLYLDICFGLYNGKIEKPEEKRTSEA